jgi:hypothetical protein
VAPRKICALERCPEKTHARLRDKASGKRQDLCIVHAVLTKRHFKDRVELVEEWGENKVFDAAGEIVFGKIQLETKEEAERKSIEIAQDIVGKAILKKKEAPENART